MSTPTTQAELNSLIDNQIEERIDLDYKRADSLGKSDSKKTEITKDVSAMANAAGGLIIYGIGEYSDPSKKHLPEKLDPIDRNLITREWLDQVVGNIRPKIDGLVITPISLNSGPTDVVYVLDIPQATTAHQAQDGRYYKRFNFISEWMLDHEIRDVMARANHPVLTLNFKVRIESWTTSGGGLPFQQEEEKKAYPRPFFEIEVHNSSQKLAQYVTCWIKVPTGCLGDLPHNCEKHSGTTSDLKTCDVLFLTNRLRDVVGHRPMLDFSTPMYSEPYFQPILPRLNRQLAHLPIEEPGIKSLIGGPGFIEWEIQADNAPLTAGRIAVSEIEQIWEYQRKKKS